MSKQTKPERGRPELADKEKRKTLSFSLAPETVKTILAVSKKVNARPSRFIDAAVILAERYPQQIEKLLK